MEQDEFNQRPVVTTQITELKVSRGTCYLEPDRFPGHRWIAVNVTNTGSTSPATILFSGVAEPILAAPTRPRPKWIRRMSRAIMVR